MNKVTACGCNACDSKVCETGLTERPRWFPRQMITPVEMNLEANYFRDKLRRHNRLLHGYGVVCGALVCYVPKPDQSGPVAWKVSIKPGYILGPYGDEIVIEAERIVDLRAGAVSSMSGDPPGEVIDPWCSTVVSEPPRVVYVAVRYEQILTRPVRVQPVGCGCDETQCEYSRWCDGYEIGILTYCPDSQSNPPHNHDLIYPEGGCLSDCPACPTDPWVVLAKVTLGDDGQIEAIDNCACRRKVVSFANTRCYCQSGEITVDSVKVTVDDGTVSTRQIEGRDLVEVEQGQEGVHIVVAGSGFHDGVQVGLGAGATIDGAITVSDTSLDFRVRIADTAPCGPHVLIIYYPDCSMRTYRYAFSVKPRPQAYTAPPTPEAPTEQRSSRRRRPGG
jgi:hypothetical protein